MKSAPRVAAIVTILFAAALELRPVDLSCTASKHVEFQGRLAVAPISQEEKDALARHYTDVAKDLAPLFAQAGEVEARHREAFDEERQRILAADPDADEHGIARELWRSDDVRASAAESLDLQEKLNYQEARQKQIIASVPSAAYRENVEVAADRVAQQTGLRLDEATDHLAYRELLTTYAVARGLPTGSDDASIATASRQAQEVFDRVTVGVDATRDVLRTMQAADLRVELGGGHLSMNAPPPAQRAEVMRSDNPLSRSIAKHEGELSQTRLQNYVARKVLHSIEVPLPEKTAPDDSTAQKQRLEGLADELKKKSDVIVEYILVGKKKATP